MTYKKSRYTKVSYYNGCDIRKYDVCWDNKRQAYRAKRFCKYCGKGFWSIFNTLDKIFSREAILFCMTTYYFCSSKCYVMNEFSEMDNEEINEILETLKIQSPLETLDEETFEKIEDLINEKMMS